MSRGSFSRGVGEWIGAAEVYDADGLFVGMGRDTRTVTADDQAGRVTVDVTFDGPFSLAGAYTIADYGSHRIYEGPLNVGYAEALGDGLVAAHNYWPDVGLSQRFFLMVLPGGDRQLSLALISRGDRLCWTVVGENRREPASAVPDAAPSALPEDPAAGRGALLLRSGRWSGLMNCHDRHGEPSGLFDYAEVVTANGDDWGLATSGDNVGPEWSCGVECDGCSVWTPTGQLRPNQMAGSGTLYGGRALSGQFHLHEEGLRLWRREVASGDGTRKAVLHMWYRGEQRVGTAHGTLAFHPA